MLAPVAHHISKLRPCALEPFGHRLLAVKCGVHGAMKALLVLFSGLCCWCFGPQMLLLRNHCVRLADVSLKEA